ncbi:MAG TPA: siphovirus ReqiPepy6 Gp37-like family protein [Lachnospiraceae bacterium]|nr:siphovirus ReqiPepy6 Gp37-like family protein [Lachnospiraceae bacterium]
MDIYVLDKNLTMLGILEGYRSFIWNRKHMSYGTFKLQIDFNEAINTLLDKGNILFKSDDVEAGFIETKVVETLEVSGRDVITVQGKFLTHYLYRRIIWGTMNLNDTAEMCMKQIVREQCINTEASRVIPFLNVDVQRGYSDRTTKQISYKNVLDSITEIAKVASLGFRNRIDFMKKRIVFEVYRGLDRTVNQSERAPCIFSRDLENVLTQYYESSLVDYANVTLVAGEGEEEKRYKITVGEVTGLDRFELFTNAADISKEDEETEAPLTDEQYRQLLIQRGNEKLSQHVVAESFESKINLNSNIVYKKDFDLGDKVSLLDRRLGILVDTVVEEIQEVYESGRFSITVTFGNQIPQIYDKIMKEIR